MRPPLNWRFTASDAMLKHINWGLDNHSGPQHALSRGELNSEGHRLAEEGETYR